MTTDILSDFYQLITKEGKGEVKTAEIYKRLMVINEDYTYFVYKVYLRPQCIDWQKMFRIAIK